MTAIRDWSEADTGKAEAAWVSYQHTHDVSDRQGQAVAIDPDSGRVWFGLRGVDAIAAARADGVLSPLLLLRVGFSYYQRKGGRR